jgi:hypothetical protein
MAALLTALAAAMLSPSAVLAAGALAVGSCDAHGYSYDYASRARAREVALANCPGACEIKVTIARSCAAFAVDSTNICDARGWGYAASRAAAESNALGFCARYGGRACVIRAWVCDARG